MAKQTTHSLTRRSFVIECLASGVCLWTAEVVPSTLATVLPSKEKTDSIPTVTRPLACDKLGTTLMHEHVLIGEIPEGLRTASADFAVKLLNDAARVGINTVVDLTPFRDIHLYHQIANHTPVRIIASTGFYLRHLVPKWMAEMDDEKQMEDHMLREVTEGIQGTKTRAGIIKVAGDKVPLSDWEKKAFRAAARVQKVTGVGIATHATWGVREQFDLLVKTGADPERIFLSHAQETKPAWAGRSDEQVAEEVISVAKEGGSILFDAFFQSFYIPWPKLFYLMRTLCDKGYSSRLLISVDSNWQWKNQQRVFEGQEAPYFDPDATRRTYAFMMTDVVPRLLQSGFNKGDINTFLVQNPRRFFCRAIQHWKLS